jgi:hypothetical protein
MAEKKSATIKDFSKGWVTEIISDSLEVGMSPDLENVDFGASGSVKKTWGYSEFIEDAEDASISRLMIVPDRQGIEWCFKKVGTKIKVLDPVLNRWDTVIVGLTDGDVPVYEYFDATVYFISAVDNAQQLDLFRATRLTAATTLGDGTVNVDDTTAFDAAGDFYLNSVKVSYTGKTGTSFTGCTNTPVAEDNSFIISQAKIAYGIKTTLTSDVLAAASTVDVVSTAKFPAIGTFILNSVVVTYTGKTDTSFTGCTGTPAAQEEDVITSQTTIDGNNYLIPKGNITAQFAGRLWVANGSTLYASKLVDLTNFAVVGSGTGDAVEKTIESKCTALKAFYNDNSQLGLLAFAGNNKIYILDTIDDPNLSSTITTLSIFKDNVTAVNQLSTLVAPNNLYHIDFRNQVRSLGQTYANNGVEKIYSDVVSKFHETLFRLDYDFSDARSVIFGDEYWCITKEGTGEINNRLIIFNFTDGTWRLRTGVNASDIAVYDNKVIFSDAVRNKVFYLDEAIKADDEESIYFKYATPDLDLDKLSFERVRRVRVAGFISESCESTVTIYSDYATKKIGEFTLLGNNNDITGKLLQNEGTFGSMLFGGEMLGGDAQGDSIRFFIADLELTDLPDLENFRLVFENNQSNVYFEITAIKPFIMPMNETYWPQEKIIKTN